MDPQLKFNPDQIQDVSRRRQNWKWLHRYFVPYIYGDPKMIPPLSECHKRH